MKSKNKTSTDNHTLSSITLLIGMLIGGCHTKVQYDIERDVTRTPYEPYNTTNYHLHCSPHAILRSLKEKMESIMSPNIMMENIVK